MKACTEISTMKIPKIYFDRIDQVSLENEILLSLIKTKAACTFLLVILTELAVNVLISKLEYNHNSIIFDV